jgi:hypothetical protein
MDINEEDFDALFRGKIRELDHSYPAALPDKDALWAELESRFPGNRIAPQWRYALAIAASATLLLVASLWWFKQEANDGVTVTYRTEIVGRPKANGYGSSGGAESQGISFIEEQCRIQRPVCSSSAFLELKRELDQLTLQTKQVNQRMKTFGPDPALIKAEIRLENHKAYLIRELIQILKV